MAKSLDLKVTLSAVNKATGPLKKIMQGSRGVGRAMKETREELRDLNDQQKRLRGFRDMSRQSLETRDALREKREELDRLTREINTTTGPTRRLTQQQAKAREAVDKLNNEYRDQRARVRELSKNLPQAADGVKGFQRHQERLEEQVRETTERLNRQRDALGRLSSADVGGRFRKMTGEIGSFGRRLAGVTAGAGAGLFALAKSTATLGDDVAKTADKLGIGTRQLQELRYAAERSGLSTQTLDTATQRMVRRVSEAAQGSGAAKDAIAELGLSAKALAGMTPDQQLSAFADALQGVESQGDRVRLMMKVFDTEGVAMVNMLRDGSAGLEQYYRDARAVGYALGDDATRGSEAFNDALLDAQSGLKGMRNTIGAELLPAVTELMKDLSGWMRENRDEVRAFARTFGDKLKEAVPVIRDVARGVGRLATTLGNLTSKAADAVGGFDNLAFIVGGLFASKAIFSVFSFAAGVGKAIGALGAFAKTLPIVSGAIKTLSLAFAATPVGWLVGGLAAVAAAGIYLWRNWETIGPKLSELWDGVKEKASAVWDWMKEAPGKAGDAVVGYFKNWTLPGLLITNWDEIKATGGELWDWFKSAPSNAIEAVKQMIADWDLKGVIKEKWDAAIDYLKNLPGRMKDAGVDAAKGLANGVKNRAGAAADGAREMAGTAVDAVRGLFDTNSPSKVFASIGRDVTDGLRIGIRKHQDEPARQAGDMARRVRQAGAGLAIGAASLAVPAAAAAGGSATTAPIGMPSFDSRPPISAPTASSGPLIGSLNINVQASPGMDEQALASYVAAEVERAMVRAEREAQARRRSAFHDID